MAVSSTAVLSKSLLNIDDEDFDDVYVDTSSVHNTDLNTNLIKSASFIFINDLILNPLPSSIEQQKTTVNNQNLKINKVGSYVELRLKRLSVTNSNSFFNQQTMSSNGSVSMSLYKSRSRSASMSDSTSRTSSSSSFSSLFNCNNEINKDKNDTKYRKNKKSKKSSKNYNKKKLKLCQTPINNNNQTLTSTLTSTSLTTKIKKVKKKKSSSNATNSNCSKLKKSNFNKLNDDYLTPKSCIAVSGSLSNFSISNNNNNNNSNFKNSKKLKCLLVGDARVGKSALMFFFLKRIFQSEYQPTIVDDYEVKIVQNGESYTLSLFDTAGQEDWETLRVMAYPDTDVIILCFSVVRPDSMENIKIKWMPELNKYLPDAIIILVGTQVDLRDQSLNNNNNNSNNNIINTNNNNNLQQRFISTREGEELKQKISAFKYIECSALTQLNIKEVFDSCIEAYAKSNPPIEPSCFQTLFRRLTKTIRRQFNYNERSSSTNSNSNSNKSNAKLTKYSNSKESTSRKYLHHEQ